MNPTASRRPLPLTKAAACLAAAVLALTGCEDRVAGTSVGTGNPTEIKLGFRDDAGAPVSVTGTLKVYASTQIPVPGLSPDPLLAVDVPGATSASLKAEAFQGLADSLWPQGSKENGDYGFNLVVTGASQGAILRGFAFRKAGSRFVLGDAEAQAKLSGTLAEITGTMEPLVDIECAVDTTSLSANWDYFLFLYGTGFAAKGASGKFVFRGIPGVSHRVSFIPIPRKDSSNGTQIDSLDVYRLSADIMPGAVNSLQVGEIEAILPIPEPLKPR